MLRPDARGGPVGTPKHDRAAHLAAGHVQCFGGGIDDLVDRLHGEVESHEFHDRLQPVHRRTNRHAGKAVFGNWRINHPPRPKFVKHALGDFVGALVLRDFLAHQEHVLVGAHFQRHRLAQRLAHGGGFGFAPIRLRQFLWRWCRFGVRWGGGFWRLRRLGLGRFFRGGRGRFTLRPQRRDHGIHSDPFGAFIHQDGQYLALIDGFHFHGRLIGLDLGDHVAGFHILPHLLQPFGEFALRHGW